MLRKLSAALLATALIAGPAFAAAPATGTTSTPSAAGESTPAKHVRKPVAHHQVGKIKSAHHVKRARTHRTHIAVHSGKPAKAGKISKTSQTSKTSTGSRTNKTGAGTHG